MEPAKHKTVYVSALGAFSAEDAGERPVPADMPNTKHIFLGGCVQEGVGSRVGGDMSVWAHAHCSPEDPRYGWVCFEHPEDFEDTNLRLHEDAHIETGGGHDDKWRAALRAKGGVVLPQYEEGGEE